MKVYVIIQSLKQRDAEDDRHVLGVFADKKKAEAEADRLDNTRGYAASWMWHDVFEFILVE